MREREHIMYLSIGIARSRVYRSIEHVMKLFRLTVPEHPTRENPRIPLCSSPSALGGQVAIALSWEHPASGMAE